MHWSRSSLKKSLGIQTNRCLGNCSIPALIGQDGLSPDSSEADNDTQLSFIYLTFMVA
jgi:hypothetical protein